MEQTITFVMLDTMVYLHYQSPEHLCLTKLLSADEVTVLVPRITIHELDTHKNTHQSSKIRERARKRLSAIQKWIDAGQITSKVSINFSATQPGIDFTAHGLNPQWNDDQLLAAVIQFKDEHPEERILLLTQDTGLLLMAKHIGLEAIMVPDDKRLLQEEDPLAKENQELRNKLLRLKTARPNLILRFCGARDESTHGEFKLEVPREVSSFDKDGLLAELQNVVPEMHPDPPAPAGSLSRSIALTGALGERIPDSEYERYNRERKAYFEQMLDYVDRLSTYRTQPNRTLLLELELRNLGTVPGEDINIDVHFPDGFELYSEDDLPGEPRKPSPPEKPMTEWQRRMAGFMGNLACMPNLGNFSSIGPLDPFSLRKTNSYELTDHLPQLKHGCSYAIRRLYLVFPSYEAAESFNFDFRIAAANLPEPSTGRVHMVVRKK